MSRQVRLPSPGVALSTIALLVALGGTGFAVSRTGIPDARVFHACSAVGTGRVRVVRVPSDCHKRAERAISWLQSGPPGPKGPNGAGGAPGRNGINGADGVNHSSLVARVRSAGPQTATSTEEPVELTGQTWPQAATEVQELAFRATVHHPKSSDCNGNVGGTPFPATFIVNVSIDGKAYGAAIGGAGSEAGDSDLVLNSPNTPLFEPGVGTTHTLTATIFESCGFGGPPAVANDHFVLKSLKVDVETAR